MASLLSTSQPTYSYDVDGITRAEPKQRTWVVLSGVAVMAVVGALLVLGSTQSAVSYKVLTTTAPTVAAPRTATRGQALSGVRAVPVVGQNARLNAQQTAAARSQGASAVNTDALDAGVEAQEVPEAVYVADTQTNYSAAAPLGFLAGVLATAAFFVTRGSKQQELPRYAMMATGKSSQKGKQTGKGAAAPAATDASERGGRAWALQQPGISAPFPGMFDPLNLAANASEKDVRRWREAELTHGLSLAIRGTNGFQPPATRTRMSFHATSLRSTTTDEEGATPPSTAAEEEVDCIVIGSGIGGLSCAGLLAATGRSVKVLEKHYEIGGCAHEFYMDLNGRTVPSASINNLQERQDLFHFEAGPSLYSGLSDERSPHPLKHIYQMIGEEPEWITYEEWGAFLPEVPEGYQMGLGADEFVKILEKYGGPGAVEDWEMLAEKLRPLASGIKGIPNTAIRSDAGILLTVALKHPLSFLSVLRYAPQFSEPFDLDALGLRNAFLRNYLDMLAFLLQGLPADQTLKVVMAYMVEDFFKENAVLDFPKGGSGELMAALARGVTKRKGCTVEVSTAVDEVLVENGRAMGVRVAKSGRVIRARQAVISNADLTNTYNFIPRGMHEGFDKERDTFLGATNDPKDGSVPYCKSFMHLHLGVKAELIPDDAPAQWTVVQDWSKGIDAVGNVVIVSVGSKLDPSLAPPGYHVIHAYTAGNEPYEDWEQFEHLMDDAVARDKDKEYQAFKDDRAQPIWDAIQRRAPAVVKGAVTVEKVATPLTHARFLSRHRGNYGLAIAPGNKEGWAFPEVTTPIEGFFRCGDSTTSGIGVPATASSGAFCANAIMSVWEQLALNAKIKMP